MPVTIESRRMTAAERQQLGAIGGARSGSGAWWAWPILICVLAAGALFLQRWLEPLWGTGHRGADTLAPALVAGLGIALFLALIAAWVALRVSRAARNNRRRIFGSYWDDLEAGTVDEERYEFLASLSARDGETGVPIHLLRIDAQRCLVVFGEPGDGADRPDDDTQPRRRALLRRAPRSRHVLSLRFEGEALASEPSDALGWQAPGWEWNGRVWEVEWEPLVQRLGQRGD
ncbi:hypothetical protein [Lysobacter enzymogenes]|uniref:hypothetical protein n=1 Tax=Lysobacter enzymogenes TaxID=69 RepID=UPI001A96EA21|nr:hypothetical protein [Lysobacter enzymogenes]QQP96162.1 hypothetical protein JHW38_23635 [Lysobacter enzymogenes]